MDREERRLRRRKDTRDAVVVLIVFAMIVALVVAGAVFGISKLMSGRNHTPVNGNAGADTQATETQETESIPQTEEPEATEAQTQTVVDPLVEQAAQIVSGMTLEEKVAQMFFITPEALTGYGQVTVAGDATNEAYQKYPVGGLIYNSQNLVDIDQTKTMMAKMQQYADSRISLPVFLGVDEEGGSVTRIASNEAYGITNVNNMSDIGATGDTQNAYQAGVTIGTYLSDLGFNLDFAPVADVLTVSDSVIGNRSFGTDSELVASMALSELQGLESMGIQGVVKHFPGHGGVSGDSHSGAVSTDKSLEELFASELVPFQRAIDGGAQFLMVGHIAAPNVTGDDTPASLSKVMITDVLRTQMGYQGVVITDAMNMTAITANHAADEAAVLAVNAGADMILMPEDFGKAYNGVIDAVNNGTIEEYRINEAVVRIVKAKLALSAQ
uniref:glycoside hydrolase family 3 protein n=1 Tax=Roseburia sp. TaxID=2049040 RepID=UPI003FF0E5E4